VGYSAKGEGEIEKLLFNCKSMGWFKGAIHAIEAPVMVEE